MRSLATPGTVCSARIHCTAVRISLLEEEGVRCPQHALHAMPATTNLMRLTVRVDRFGRFFFARTDCPGTMLSSTMLRRLLLVSSLTPAVVWVTTSQATYGVGIMDIVTMMRGGAYGSHVRHWQFGQLGHLWSYNPQGRTGAAGTPNTSNVRETMMGLGGGITWAWDPTLCAALDPLFNEDPWASILLIARATGRP